MDILLRTADRTEAALICDLARTTFLDTYALQNTEADTAFYLAQNFTVEKITAEFDEPNALFFLAFLNDELVGYAKVRTVEHPLQLKGRRHLEIERIYVKQGFQGHKIGYRLIRHCIETAKAAGFEVIWLGVWEENRKAIEFYEKVGFQVFGTHPFQFGNSPQNDFLLKMEL